MGHECHRLPSLYHLIPTLLSDDENNGSDADKIISLSAGPTPCASGMLPRQVSNTSSYSEAPTSKHTIEKLHQGQHTLAAGTSTTRSLPYESPMESVTRIRTTLVPPVAAVINHSNIGLRATEPSQEARNCQEDQEE